jgi:hypothetical protein
VTQHVSEKNVLKQQSLVKNVRCKERIAVKDKRGGGREGVYEG